MRKKIICNGTDCINCELPKCVYDDIPDEDDEPRDRSAYMREYYRRKRAERNKICVICGKACEGEMLRMSKQNFCGTECLSEYLLTKNESRITKIVV